jgi:predicted CXXCH cytochrome family protein
MEVEVTFLTVRGSAVMRRSRRVDARRVRFGRGTGNEVQLPDIRVDLNAAALFPRSGVLTIQAVGPSPLRVNGRSTRSASIGLGDEVLIGPYRIQLSEPPPGCDAALLIELVQPLGDALARLMLQARSGVEGAPFGKRAASWTGFLIVALVFLAGPMIVYFYGSAPFSRAIPGDAGALAPIVALWEPGELSNSHRFFAANCAACHRAAFARVPDDACLGCHGGVGSHTAASAEIGGTRHAVERTQCTQCHEEHRGSHAIIVSETRLCLQCHGSIAKSAPATDTRDVSGFPGHPQFRVTLVANTAGPRFERVELGSTPPPTDRPGIKFSHKAHLDTIGAKALGDRQVKGCADCHTPEPAGEGLLPITYKGQCQSCHALDFERQELPWPNARVPHGDDIGVAAAVWNFYAGKALQGGISQSQGPESQGPAITRRVPGTPTPGTPTPATPSSVAGELPGGNARAWVAEKTEAALRTIIFDEKRGCAYCHIGTGPQGAFDLSIILPVGVTPPGLTSGRQASGQAPARIVAPVVMRTRFLPRARFNHAKHAAVECEQCHAARRAETSGTVLIPGIENCVACHSSERAGSRAESTCLTCHRFHQTDFGPMRTAGAAAQ